MIHISKSISVTYRVHPLECIDQAKNAFKDSNVKVTKGGDIKQDILNHDIILHAGCSVCIDCLSVGVKSVFILPFSDELNSTKCNISLNFKKLPSLDELRKLYRRNSLTVKDYTKNYKFLN